MVLPDPTYHGNPLGDLVLLMRLLYTTFVLRLWFVVPVMAIVAWEWYSRYEARIRTFASTIRGFGARALRVPAPQLSRVLVKAEKAKARKAVA